MCSWPSERIDESIHGLGIGEAYLRHSGRPAKVKLIRADINPPGDFDLSEDLPRFSQGNEPPLNLTEKVNRIVMSRMQEAKNKSRPKEGGETTSQVGKPKRKNEKGKTQSSHGDLKDGTSVITHQDNVSEVVSQPLGHNDSTQNAPNTPTPQLPPTHVDSREEPASRTSLRRREKLEWYGTWEDD